MPGRVALVAAGVAALLAVAFLLAPPMGTDLAAQVARVHFFERYGWAPVDFGWYGGISPYGYSLFTPALGALIGVRPLGALAAVVAAGAFGWLLARHGAHRPVTGAVLGAVVLVGNLASGRITFAVGLALGLLALVVASARRPVPRPVRLGVVALLAALATWASPVAGLFTGVAGAALLLATLFWPAAPLPGATAIGSGAGAVPRGLRARIAASDPGRLAGSLTLCLAPALALAPMALLFGNGGRQPYSAESMRINVALAVLVLVLLPKAARVLRVGAGLTVVLLVAAYYLPSPVGSNALRLPMLWAVPLLAAYVPLPGRWLAALLAATVWWQPPVMTSDVVRAGSAPIRPEFHQPLADELARRQPVGRVEVVPLRDHGEAAYLPGAAPLARGWERQVDTDRNPLFYRDGLDRAGYVDWLRHNAVSYVALAPDSPPDRYAREEAALVLAGLPELREVWRDANWRLYEVMGALPLVAAPGRLTASDQGGIDFTVPGGTPTVGDVPIRVRWSRWLSLTGPGGCLARSPDGFVTVRDPVPGTYRLTSALRPAGRC